MAVLSSTTPPPADDMQAIEADLRAWVEKQLSTAVRDADIAKLGWVALDGDAGFRKYFRAAVPACDLIAAYSPPNTENNAAFLAIDNVLFEHGVRVPKIVAYDEACGFFLMEDLGETMLLDHLTSESVNGHYAEAFVELLKIQQCPPASDIFPHYDRFTLAQELQLFPQWFVQSLLGHSLTASEEAMLAETFEHLLASAEDQPQVVVHRDFHSRNLVYAEGRSPGVIDFQDAVIGPVTYDVVSLLRDCYIAWPDEQVCNWLQAYGAMAADAGIIPEVSEAQLQRWFDMMGLQRHIKVLGIFARLSLRDGKHRYLDDLPLVLAYVRRICRQHEVMQPFIEWFDSTLLPLAEQQAWYQTRQ